MVLGRTPRGQALLDKAKERGDLVMEPISSDEVTQGAEEILLQELDALGPVKMSALALRMAMLMQGALVLEKNGVDITELGKTMKAKQDEAALN